MNGRQLAGYIARETLLNTVLSVAFSVMFAYLFFHKSQSVDLGSTAVLFDTVPQCFFVALMTFLIPTLLTRSRQRSGAIGRMQGGHVLPENVYVRSIVAGVVAAVVCAAVYAVAMPAPGAVVLPLREFLAFKGIGGAILATLLGPVALSAALKDAR